MAVHIRNLIEIENLNKDLVLGPFPNISNRQKFKNHLPTSVKKNIRKPKPLTHLCQKISENTKPLSNFWQNVKYNICPTHKYFSPTTVKKVTTSKPTSVTKHQKIQSRLPTLLYYILNGQPLA